MAAADQLLKNFNVFVNGRSFIGRIADFSPPKITLKTEDYQAGGMDAPIEIDVGLEKLETSFNLTGYDAGVMGLVGVKNGSTMNPVQIVAKGALEDGNGSVTAVEVTMQGIFKAQEPEDWKPGATSKIKFTSNLRYYRFVHGGKVIHEIDLLNFIRVVNGVDQLAAQRAAIGAPGGGIRGAVEAIGRAFGL